MPRLFSAAVAAAALALSGAVAALPTITTKGSKFFTSDGNQWYIKGIAYQLLPADPLVDTAQCQLDATLMQSLGANAIRVYHVNPSLNHDGCMQAFADAGIYVFVDLDTFPSAVTQQAPAWTAAQMGAFMFVMDTFQGYDNVAGFFIANEVINSVGPYTLAAPYVKASVADLKAYRDAMGYRNIPIGYSHADVAGLRPILQDYLVCGESSQAIDFFGLNCYEWCGDNTFTTSGYEYLLQQTTTYPVPIFMSETGCNVPEPRTFGDQNAIFTNMSEAWSGAVIYEWIQEENHYGIVTYNTDNTDALDYAAPAGGVARSGTPLPVTPDFGNLMAQWATLNPTGVSMADYEPTNPAMACPASTAGVWEVDPSAPLPTLGLNVAIPTSSALAEADWGLASYTTPKLGVAATPTSVNLATATAAGTTSSAVSTSASSAAVAASSSAESIRSSLQSSALSVQSSESAASSSATPASTTASSAISTTATSTSSVSSHSASSISTASSTHQASSTSAHTTSHSMSTTSAPTDSASAASASATTSTGAAPRNVQGLGAGLAGLLAGVAFLV